MANAGITGEARGEGTGQGIATPPEIGQLVQVRNRQWIVSEVSRSALRQDVMKLHRSPPQHLVTLASVEDDALGEELRAIWEIEPGARVIEKAGLPVVDGWDEPSRLMAFLDAVRWGAVTSADRLSLQAPFRSGIELEGYQLEPLVRALDMPRVNLLVADDVGLGKTIETGLVLQELLLRHRARTMLVVCPASLQIKWREEMRDKFGLEFRIVDTAYLKQLRRDRGIHVNPWTSFPRLITSMDWVKMRAPMRWFRDLLPRTPTWPRKFDILVVDEAHNVAPSGTGNYALDSQRTAALRELAPHFEHRLFLTATPHNGYTESWTALLAMLDPQRFAIGVKPEETKVATVVVRRLKTDIVDENGDPVFPKRQILPLEVSYSEKEREIHAVLQRYTESWSGQDNGNRRIGSDFVLKLLKKRLISCPAAFSRTLEKHRATAEGRRQAGRRQRREPRMLLRALKDAEEDRADDVVREERFDHAVDVATDLAGSLADDQTEMLDAMKAWADRAERRPDSKTEAFLAWLDEHLLNDGSWNDQRVIVFTEYKTTLDWLRGILARLPESADRIMTMYGGMDDVERERIKAAFQADPSVAPVRILLATDSASEGIDLQNWCSMMVHWEIPWNPSVLEQRNGRIDRHGQKSNEVRIWHFVPSGWKEEDWDADRKPGTLEGDLEFLMRAAVKVNRIREDLGKVGPVIEEQLEEAMLGRRRDLDTMAAERDAERARAEIGTDRRVRERVERLHARLLESRKELRVSPETVRDVVRVALDVANQPALRPVAEGTDTGPWAIPPMEGSWARCAEGLAHPHTGDIRPVTFDHDAVKGRDDVVLAHLEHPLVQRCLRLLRAEIWASESRKNLHRVTALTVPNDALSAPAVVGWGRLVIVGRFRHRLHEELVFTGGSLAGGRFKRLNQGEITSALDVARSVLPSDNALDALARDWPKFEKSLVDSFDARQKDRLQYVENTLLRRRDKEVDDMRAILIELENSIQEHLREAVENRLPLFPDYSTKEQDQVRRNETALRARLEAIPTELEREEAAIRARYSDLDSRLFPAAIAFLVPESWKGVVS